ncbi:GntR family transcriptional regulator [Allokutzneria sp. A3M-2-11 16]|uniref:GntR family transcriptional regulator n=1 Tax=Allokutzneria sp. A3M-2-11 16 TaxID=2962043 RepID=UPI0020B71DB7|nr:GntR family transcriptional regulator [Allokutzneria sp. A3M-2-11 16]MCP3800491.1 GntR family transcriptional regulator [Allokutzneria sp. A3M-2-11 16]
MTEVALAAEKAYEVVRTAILDGSYPPGERLGEVELAEALGISRTPIREALRRLEVEGLVEVLPHRGARVASWSREDLDEIYELRILLESFAAARAASRISDGELGRMDELREEMDRAVHSGDVERIAACNAEFHGIIRRAASSTRLVTMLNAVIQLPLVLQTFHRYTHEDLQRSVAHHGELVHAFRARDPAWAESVMRSHVLAARRVLAGRSRDEE